MAGAFAGVGAFDGVSGRLQSTCWIALTAVIVGSDFNSSFSGFVLLLLIASLSESHTLHMTHILPKMKNFRLHISCPSNTTIQTYLRAYRKMGGPLVNKMFIISQTFSSW